MFDFLRRAVVLILCVLVGSSAWKAEAAPIAHLSKSAAATASPGGLVTYTLKLQNRGAQSIQDAVIEDVIAAGVGYVSGSASPSAVITGDHLTFSLGTLAPGASKSATYRVRVSTFAKIGASVQSAGALFSASNTPSVTSNSAATVLVPARHVSATGPGVIVFATRRAPATDRQIYSINADGSNLTQLTNDNSLYHSQVALSPDGSKIVFLASASDNKTHLYLMNAAPQSATNPVIQLTNPTAGLEPDNNSILNWSPNGRQVVYAKFLSNPVIADLTPQTSTHRGLYLSSIVGSQFAFSPDGSKLVFSRYVSATECRISAFDLDVDSSGTVLGEKSGAVENVLFSDALVKFLPTFSPDGAKIAFVQRNSAMISRNSDLYVLDVASKVVTRLTTDQNVFEDVLGATSWSPDGSLIAFGSDGPGRKPDGTLTTQGIDGVYTIRPVPATDQNGNNFPSYISEGNTGYYPHFAQVKTPVNTTSLSGSLRKTATATSNEFGTSISTVSQGDTFFYHIFFTLKNGTSSAINNVTVKDQIPAQTTYVSGGDATETDASGAKFVVFNIGTIDAGATVSGISTFSVKVAATAKVDDVILNPGGRYFALNNGTQLFGNNPVTLKVTAATGKLVLTKTLLQLNGKVVTDPKKTLAPGDELLYLLSFSNQTSAAINNLVATDAVPANTTATKGAYFTDANGNAITTPVGYRYQIGGDPKIATYTITKLDAGVTAYAILGGKVNAVANGIVIRNTATLKADGVASQTATKDNTVSAFPIIYFQGSFLSINGSTIQPGGTVIPGDTIRYLFRYANGGNLAAKSVVITDPIPLNTRGVGVDFTDAKGVHIAKTDGSTADLTPPNGTLTNGSAVFKLPRIEAGAEGFVTVSVLVNNDAAAKATQISNQGYSLTADGGINVKPIFALTNALRAPLAISKKLALLNGATYNGLDKVRGGDLLTYEIKVSNPAGNGAATANNVTVTDFIPLDATFKNVATGGTFNPNNPPFVSYSIPSLVIGASKTLQFSVTVNAGAGTSIVNRDYGAQISGLNRRFTGTAVTTDVFQLSKLTVSKTATVIETGSTTQIAAGQNLREVFTVTNTGGVTLFNVRLNVPMSPELAFSQAFLGTVDAPVSGAKPLLSGDGRTLTYQLGTLAIGQSASATLESQLNFQTKATSIVLGSDFADTPSSPVVSATDAPITLKVGGIRPPRPFPFFRVMATSDGETEITQVSPDTQFTLVFKYVNAVRDGKGATLRGATISTLLPAITRDGISLLPRIVSSSVPFTQIGASVSFNIGNIAADAAPGKIRLVLVLPATAQVGNTLEFIGFFNTVNYGEVLKDSVQVKVVAVPKIDIGVALNGSSSSKQKTPDGRLKPGAVIDYQIIGSNAGDGTATGVNLRGYIPAYTSYIDNSAKFSTTSGTVRSGSIVLSLNAAAKVDAVNFKPTGGLKKNDTFMVSYSVRLNSDVPQGVTKIETAALLDGTGPDGKLQSVASNTDTQKVFIPAPAPAFLALHVSRDTAGARGAAFTTSFDITNYGGTTAHDVILRYSFEPEVEGFVSASDGGSPVGVGVLPRTIFWDGQSGNQAAKFANLEPGGMIHVTLVTRPKNDKKLRILTGEIAETLEKNTGSGPTRTSNPITRYVPQKYILLDSSNLIARGAKSAASTRTASGANIFTLLGDLLNSFGAAIGNAIFGGSKNANPALTKKLENLDLSTSRSAGSAGEDFVALTLPDGQTVTLTPIIAGTMFRIEGPASAVKLVASGGGNVISRDGAGLVASGGGNAISIQTSVGLRSVAQIFSALLSQDGGGLRDKAELYRGGSGTLISQDGGGLISQDGGGLVIPLSSLVASGGGNLVASGGGNLLGPNATLISQDGGGFTLKVGASLISQDGGGLVASGGGNLLSNNSGTLVASGGGNVYNLQGNDFHGIMASSLVASGGGNLVASGGGN